MKRDYVTYIALGSLLVAALLLAAPQIYRLQNPIAYDIPANPNAQPPSVAFPTILPTSIISSTNTIRSTNTISGTETISPTETLTPTEIISPTETVSPTTTITPSAIISRTETVSPTITITPSQIVSPTETLTPTDIISPTETISPTQAIPPPTNVQVIATGLTNIGANGTIEVVATPLVYPTTLRWLNGALYVTNYGVNGIDGQPGNGAIYRLELP